MALCCARTIASVRPACTIGGPVVTPFFASFLAKLQLYGKSRLAAEPGKTAIGRARGCSWHEHDFAGGSGLENLLVRSRGFRKRQLFAYHRAQRAVFQADDQPGMDVRFFGGRNPPKCEGTNRA